MSEMNANAQNAVNKFLDTHEELSKSMVTGHNFGSLDQEGASALRRQSLANDVKVLTFNNQDFTILGDIARTPANSTVEEYTIQTGYGEAGASRFVSETGIGTINDPELARKIVKMKAISDTRQTSIMATIVNNTANPLQIQQESALLVIAKTIEEGIFNGDADLTSMGEGQGLQFDGLKKLIDQNNNVLDARGGSMTETLLNKASVIVAKGFGRATDAYMPIGVHADFVNNQLGRQWVAQGQGSVNSGYTVPQFASTRGNIALHGSTILENEEILEKGRIVKHDAPAKPIVKATVAEAKGQFADEDIKAQEYAVVVVSQAGKSAPEFVSATVASNKSEVTIEVEPANLYQARPDFVEVYRKGNETGEFFLIAREGFYKADGAGKVKLVDANGKIPETASVFVGEMNPQVLQLMELLPATRLDLAQVNATLTFTVLWYGALALYAPKKWVEIKNVKTVHGQVH